MKDPFPGHRVILFNRTAQKSALLRYFLLTNCTHQLFGCDKTFHLNLAKQARLKWLSLLILKPPTFFGVQILFQAMGYNFFSLPQKKSLHSLFKLFKTLSRHLKQDMIWLGIPVRFELIKVSQPALERVLAFHPASFCLPLLISSAAFIGSFQNTILWIQRYFSTVVLCWIWKILTISFLIWAELLEEKYKEDLWKLICCPATLENLYSILRILLAPLVVALANRRQSSAKTRLETLKPLGEDYQRGLKNSQPSCWDV